MGAINRAALLGCDYFITPLSPDLFSIKGTQNLGNKFVSWNKEWTNILNLWGDRLAVEIPKGKPKFAGYVTQQHNIRSNKEGMTLGWQLFGKKVDNAVHENIVLKLETIGQVQNRANYHLGAIPNLHSLIPYSQNAHKPVYKCTGSDGLKGAHISSARNSLSFFTDMVDYLIELPDISKDECPT